MFLNSVLLIFAAIGHLGIWVILFNQIHATGWPRKIRKGSEKIILPFVLLLPVVILVLLFRGEYGFDEPYKFYQNDTLVFYYAHACWISFAYCVGVWIYRKCSYGANQELCLNHTKRRIDVQRVLGKSLASTTRMKTLARLPFNEVFRLTVEEKTLLLPQLPKQIDGLTISHLSDLHFTGQTKRDFFEYVVAQSNALESDLTVLTGDILDMPECLDWIDEILSKLHSPLGVFYCLGNHDRRVLPVETTRDRLNNAGLIPVSGRWETIVHEDVPIHICGNDLPWFPEAKSLPANPEVQMDQGVRILLSHSPDQIYWAQDFGIDLMLAGHTHGGQIRLPLLGSIVSASKYGNAFSGGLFKVRKTLLHVTRGLSSTQPLRINCSPELVKIILKCEKS